MTRMILPILLMLVPLPAIAWQADRAGALCTLTDESGAVVLTHDPAGPAYTITVTRLEPWPDTTNFGIAFQGGAEITITTDRHERSADGLSITVTDRGFGNVLAGLSENATAMIFAGEARMMIPLAGAAPQVAIFEACEALPTA